MTRRTHMRIAFLLSFGVLWFLCWMVVDAVVHIRPLWAIFWLVLATGVWVKVRHDWDELRAMRHRVPPTNVRLVTDEGTHPVSCLYGGFDGDAHRWLIIPPDWLTLDYVLRHGVSVEADEAPPYTKIELSVGRRIDLDG